MEYFIDNRKPHLLEGEFWTNEMKKWDGLFDEHYAETKDMTYRGYRPPTNVNKTIIRIKYWYNDKLYKYLTIVVKQKQLTHLEYMTLVKSKDYIKTGELVIRLYLVQM